MREAVESVLKQSYPYWELLLADDGAAIESTEIALSYATRYPDKIRYVEHNGHQNRGMSATRQLGIRHAKGTLVAFLDADDVWLPHKLEQQVRLLESHPDVAMLYGNTQYWYSWTGSAADLERDYVPPLGVEPDTIVQPPDLLPLFWAGRAAVPCTCSVMVRRWIIDQTGGFEEIFPGMYEDQVFYAKVCLEAPVLVSGECWDRYRQHPDSCCAVASKTDQHLATRLHYLNWLKGYLHDREISDVKLWRALNQQLWLAQPSRFSVQIQGLGKWIQRWKRLRLRVEDSILPDSVCSWLWRKL